MTLATEPSPRLATRSRLAYLYLLRVPLFTGIAFAVFPYVAVKTRIAPLALGLFDVSGMDLWTVSTIAFTLSLAVMTTWFLMVAYAHFRCGVPPFRVKYPIAKGWYLVSALLAAPTLTAVYVTGPNAPIPFASACLAGFATAVVLYEGARFLVPRLDRFPVVRQLAAWLARHLEIGAGYVDPADGTFLPGHRLALALMLFSALVYEVVGRLMRDPNASPAPTLAYVLLLGTIVCWAVSALSFLLDRYRIPVTLPLVALVIATGATGGSDHYFQLQPSWYSPPVAPHVALVAHRMSETGPTSAIVVAANGGGIQAAAWTAHVLTGLEATCRMELGSRCNFSQSIRLVSSVSGGSVGAMYVASGYVEGSLRDADLARIVSLSEESSLEHIGWGLLYHDLFRPFYPHFDYEDRGSALEEAWQRRIDLTAPIESWRDDVQAGLRPATIFNATISDSGERLLMGTANPAEAAGRRNFEALYPGEDVSIATAARLSAAFPYVSPAARADSDDPASVHVVDGGYYDLYGVSSLIDWLDEALRANQQSVEPKVRRVLVLQVRGAPPDREHKGKKRGWFYQAYAPLAALLGTRGTGQLSHNDEELALLRRAWQDKVAISSAVFQFCGEAPPLSWHLTSGQVRELQDEWGREATSAATRAVMDFLTAPEIDAARPPPERLNVGGRCEVKATTPQ